MTKESVYFRYPFFILPAILVAICGSTFFCSAKSRTAEEDVAQICNQVLVFYANNNIDTVGGIEQRFPDIYELYYYNGIVPNVVFSTKYWMEIISLPHKGPSNSEGTSKLNMFILPKYDLKHFYVLAEAENYSKITDLLHLQYIESGYYELRKYDVEDLLEMRALASSDGILPEKNSTLLGLIEFKTFGEFKYIDLEDQQAH